MVEQRRRSNNASHSRAHQQPQRRQQERPEVESVAHEDEAFRIGDVGLAFLRGGGSCTV